MKNLDEREILYSARLINFIEFTYNYLFLIRVKNPNFFQLVVVNKFGK